MTRAAEVARSFVDRINARDVEGLCALMTEDHAFVDGAGTRVVGREAMRDAWTAYFRMIPDYRIRLERVVDAGDAVLLAGRAGGTVAAAGGPHDGDRWETPAAWQAVVAGGRIARWQVYADLDPLRRILQRAVVRAPGPVATPRFLDALAFATRLHAADLRKGTQVPYVAHLLCVCGLVLADGGSEDEAIAALLHDALEDHPEETSREEIAARFGPRVLAIVEHCTDTPPDYKGGPKPPWRERKTAYLARLGSAGPEARRVALADKVDNARSMVAAHREVGERIWKRFNAPKADQLWLLRSLVRVFREAGAPGALLPELELSVAELERLSCAEGD